MVGQETQPAPLTLWFPDCWHQCISGLICQASPSDTCSGLLYSLCVYELLPCLSSHWGSFLQSAFMNSPAVHYGHSMTFCLLHSRSVLIADSSGLWSLCDFVPVPQHVSTHQGLICIVVTLWLCACTTHSRLLSDQTTSTHSTAPATSPIIITTAFISPINFFCVCVLLIICTFHYSQHSKCNVNIV